MLQYTKLALQQGLLGQMPAPYAPQAFIVPQYPGNCTDDFPKLGFGFCFGHVNS